MSVTYISRRDRKMNINVTVATNSGLENRTVVVFGVDYIYNEYGIMIHDLVNNNEKGTITNLFNKYEEVETGSLVGEGANKEIREELTMCRGIQENTMLSNAELASICISNININEIEK